MRSLEPIFSTPGLSVSGACLNDRPGPSRLTQLKRELKKGRGGYVAVMALDNLRRRREASIDAVGFFERHGVPTRAVRRLYSDETLDHIRSHAPDAIVRCGFGIIREPLLSLAPRGVLSYHHGDIRAYRGQPVGFWELYHGESEMGVTVQVLAAGLDCGPIVRELRVPILETDSWRSLYERAYERSPQLLAEACQQLCDEGFEPETVPEDALGPVYTSPNLRQWLTLQLRVAKRIARARLRPAGAPGRPA